MDGRTSSDPNAACGDSIVSYQWDINGNGSFGDAVDVSGPNPTIPWATLNTLNKFADPVTGLPSNTITLKVTDSFGVTNTTTATISIYRTTPIAKVVQNPNPAPINLLNGSSNPTLDGRESSSPTPNVTIATYDWDLNDDGTFETLNQPFVVFNKVFNPVPQPNAIPPTFVSLRVTDTLGHVGTVRYQVMYSLPPTPPTADADPTDPPEKGYNILVGDGVTLDASQSSDPDTAQFGDFITVYRWDVANVNPAAPVWDRVIPDANGDKVEAKLPLTWADLNVMGVNGPGSYRIVLEVEDTTHLTGRDTAPLNVYARNPNAAFTVNPNPAACGARLTFDGSASAHPDPDVRVVRWQWDFTNDGTYDAEGQQVAQVFNQFTFGQPITSKLLVTDSNGATGSTTVQVNVNQGNRNPVAVPGGPYTIARTDGVTLDGRGSSDPDAACGDAVARWEWDLRGDGTYQVQLGGQRPAGGHVGPTPGGRDQRGRHVHRPAPRHRPVRRHRPPATPRSRS